MPNQSSGVRLQGVWGTLSVSSTLCSRVLAQWQIPQPGPRIWTLAFRRRHQAGRWGTDGLLGTWGQGACWEGGRRLRPPGVG